MTEFKREERFIVIKRKHLHDYTESDLRSWLRSNQIPTCECVVVESDWSEYETVWKMIEARVSGATAQPAADGERELQRDGSSFWVWLDSKYGAEMVDIWMGSNHHSKVVQFAWTAWQARAALPAKAEVVAVPAGYALVTIEPTVEVLIAISLAMGVEPLSDGTDGGYPITGRQSTARQVYLAALAAAPVPPVQESAEFGGIKVVRDDTLQPDTWKLVQPSARGGQDE